MPIDDRTTNRSYQLPNAANQLIEDVARLRAALTSIDADIFARYTKTEVDQLIANLISGAPGVLDTLDELAAALGDDANFAATVTNQLALKADSSNVYSKAEADARYVQGTTQAEMVFIATANQSVFTLSTAVINKPSALVTVDGVVQPTSEYSLNMAGTQLTLSEGVPVGTIVRVLALGVASEGAPADDTVTTIKLRDLAVTAAKLAADAVTEAKIANAAVTPLKLSAGAGSADQVLSTDGSQLAWVTRRRFQEVTLSLINQPIFLELPGGIPSWARRITLAIYGITTNGSTPPRIQLGDASITPWSVSYQGRSGVITGTAANQSNLSTTNDGFLLSPSTTYWSSSHVASGTIVLERSSNPWNGWIANGQLGSHDHAQLYFVAGVTVFHGTITRLRFYINGVQNFTGGYCQITFEG